MPPVVEQAKARIYRVTHADNLPWIARNGLHCATSTVCDPAFRPIGRGNIIEGRNHRVVTVPPGGRLCDYVPFYFTSKTPMLLNIKTGYAGLQQYPMSDLVILVSSLHRLAKLGLDFVFSDRHAYLERAEFYKNLTDLGRVAWEVIASGDFKRRPDQPERFDFYQAEALVPRHVPVEALLGVACYSRDRQQACLAVLEDADCQVPVAVQPDWFV